jgi:hypothetical protein
MGTLIGSSGANPVPMWRQGRFDSLCGPLIRLREEVCMGVKRYMKKGQAKEEVT